MKLTSPPVVFTLTLTKDEELNLYKELEWMLASADEPWPTLELLLRTLQNNERNL